LGYPLEEFVTSQTSEATGEGYICITIYPLCLLPFSLGGRGLRRMPIAMGGRGNKQE